MAIRYTLNVKEDNNNGFSQRKSLINHKVYIHVI